LRTEFVELSFATAFHSFTNSVDVTSGHVIELAVLPNKLDVGKTLLKASVRVQSGFHSAEVHGVFHDLRIV
jgi:hypothetical protein